MEKVNYNVVDIKHLIILLILNTGKHKYSE